MKTERKDDNSQSVYLKFMGTKVPIADEQYALEKLGRRKYELAKSVGRKLHWDIEGELYCSEIDMLSRCNTLEDIYDWIEDCYVFRDAVGGKPKPHLKYIKGGAL